MHLAPVVMVPHAAGPEGWSGALSRLGSVLSARPHLPLTIRMPGAAIDHVRLHEPELFTSLESTQVAWLAGGWSDPILAALPAAAAQSQIDREATAMAAAGIVPAGLWVGDSWEPGLIDFANENGFRILFVDQELIETATNGPAVVERAGTAAVVIPVLKGPPPESRSGDGLATVAGRAEAISGMVKGRHFLTTPDRYLTTHAVPGRVVLTSGTPGRSPEADIFFRKLLRIAADWGDRKSALDSVLSLQSREYVTEVVPAADDQALLVRTRKEVDRVLHRGDSWVTSVEVDWDADALPETVIETAHASLVVDPADGSIPVWDDKASHWPITAVTPASPLALVHQMTPEGNEPPGLPMELAETIKGRAEATVLLKDPRGLTCRIHLVERSVEIEITVPELDQAWIGPEIPVALNADETEVRVDGGDWVPVPEPVGFSGHRFRIRDNSKTILMSSARPAQFFVRPLSDGMVVWPHWSTVGEASYQLAITPSERS